MPNDPPPLAFGDDEGTSSVSASAGSVGNMGAFDLGDLEAFIVRAKASTYVGSGTPVASSRPGSHDLAYTEPPFAYLDSYIGGSDFLGEELVTHEGVPVWAMNYYGYLLRSDLIEVARAGAVIKESLAGMYAAGRFLGGWEYDADGDIYTDTSEGDVARFTGREWITRGGVRVYELVYHGGLVRE